MHGIDRPVLKSYRAWVVGLGLAVFVSSGCQTGESWAPKLPKFGSNLVFGSKPKEQIEPPALSFKPSESNSATSDRKPTQLAGNPSTGSSNSGQSTPRAPYSFQETSNPRESTADSIANQLPANRSTGLPNASPPASALGQLPPSPGGVGQVGYNHSEPPKSNPSSSLTGLSNSVVNSPLLPSAQNPSGMREIRSIPGGSLGNPLGSSTNTSDLGLSPQTTTRSPSLPPAPGVGAGSPLNSPAGLPPLGQSSPSRSALPSSSGSLGLPSNPTPVSSSLPNPALSNTGLPSPPMSGTAPTASSLPAERANPTPATSSFRPGSVGISGSAGGTPAFGSVSPSQPTASQPPASQPPASQPATTSAPNYGQTPHGAYPGLPAWPGSQNGSRAVAPTTPAGALPAGLPPAGLPPARSGTSNVPAAPTSLPMGGLQPTSGSTALPSFPNAGPVPGQVVCDGDQCVIR